jgi:hypothetical protein
MNTTPQQEKPYLNSRTLKQPKWHGYELHWFIEKMNWQIKVAGIAFKGIPRTLTRRD